MLGTAQAHALRAELARPLRVTRIIGIRPHLQTPALVGPVQDFEQLSLVLQRGLNRLDLARIDFTGGSIDRDPLAFADRPATHAHDPTVGVDRDAFRADDCGFAHAPGHNRGVAGLSASGGEYSLRRDHPVHVVWRCLRPHQDDLLAGAAELVRAVRVENYLAVGGTG